MISILAYGLETKHPAAYFLMFFIIFPPVYTIIFFTIENIIEKISEKKRKAEPVYKVVFCDDNDLTTKFSEYDTYQTFEDADYAIRKGWNKREEDRINNGYKVGTEWILIEKTVDK